MSTSDNCFTDATQGAYANGLLSRALSKKPCITASDPLGCGYLAQIIQLSSQQGTQLSHQPVNLLFAVA